MDFPFVVCGPTVVLSRKPRAAPSTVHSITSSHFFSLSVLPFKLKLYHLPRTIFHTFTFKWSSQSLLLLVATLTLYYGSPNFSIFFVLTPIQFLNGTFCNTCCTSLQDGAPSLESLLSVEFDQLYNLYQLFIAPLILRSAAFFLPSIPGITIGSSKTGFITRKSGLGPKEHNRVKAFFDLSRTYSQTPAGR